ncbi:hypothetical protein BLA29_015125, partial [Euroglyphus maynei]
MDVETVKKIVKKSKRKESVTKLEEEKDKDIDEETQVTVTEEIVELPDEENKPKEMMAEMDKPEEKLDEGKSKKPSKK